MRYLVDTNVLLHAAQPHHSKYASATRAVNVLVGRGEPLVVSIQNMAEFWNVATRPAENNGLGFTVEEARAELVRIESFFEIISETRAT